MNSINILHFNPDGIRGSQTNILNYIDQENIQVIAVSKPSLFNNKIEFALNYWFNKYPNLGALSVKISPSEVTGAPTDLVVYYNIPPKVIDKRLFEIVNKNSNNAVIIGDLNSPHSSFGSRINTDSGIGLEDILAQENLTWLNDPNSPTYHHPPKMLPNILVIISGNLGQLAHVR